MVAWKHCCLVLVTVATLYISTCNAQDAVVNPANDLAPQGEPKQSADVPADPQAPGAPADAHVDAPVEAPVETPVDEPTDNKEAVDEVKDSGAAPEDVDDGGAPGVEQPIALILCYQCNTEYNGTVCESSDAQELKPFLQTCPSITVGSTVQHYERCRKSVQLIQGHKRLIRSCATMGSGEAGVNVCIDRAGSYKIATRTCDCFNTDPNSPCNAATRNVVTSALLLLMTSLIYAVRR